mmetsp:Transcript_22391/g.47078  ORF Transcript_22391/g.47078 Transcript_22391/m.47078 type:complete len:81 (-) Transcript_22391:15-257(-)
MRWWVLAGNVSVKQLNLDDVDGARVFEAGGDGGASWSDGERVETVDFSLNFFCDVLEDVMVFMVSDFLTLSEVIVICSIV